MIGGGGLLHEILYTHSFIRDQVENHHLCLESVVWFISRTHTWKIIGFIVEWEEKLFVVGFQGSS